MEEYGKTGWEAASSATKEIALAVLATTLSLAVIFAPIAFMSGQVGRFFNSFGFVVGFAILLSMVVSFTLTPMLCARFLKAPAGHDQPAHAGRSPGILTRNYIRVLGWSLRHRWVIVVATAITFLSTPVLFMLVGSDFVPKDDQSEFEVAITLKEGTTLAQAERQCAEIEERLKKIRGVTNVFTSIGPTDGKAPKGQGDVTQVSIYCRMSDLRERDFHQRAAMQDARDVMADYPDIRAAVQEVKLFSSSAFKNAQLDLSLRGPDSQKLEEYAATIVKQMKARPDLFTDVDTNAASRSPELQVLVDRDRAADQGVDMRGLATALGIMVGGEPVTKFKEGSEQYDVWLRADLKSRDRPGAIGALTVPGNGGKPVELRTFARVQDERGPATIERYNRQRQIGIQCNLTPGVALGNALPVVEGYVTPLEMPPEYRYEFLGEAKLLADSNSNFGMAFMLAFVFMYMILAAQFESLVHPITILLAVPMTLPFALISLMLLRTPLDVYAMIGLFMLFGIVKKNGILQVDYTNVLRAKGLPRDEAILKANEARLRPILMTTVMLVAAMIPIATGQGPGAAARASMAKVILGGQLLSLLLSLLVTPVAYSLWDDFSHRVKRIGVWFSKRGQREPTVLVVPESVPEAAKETVRDPVPDPVVVARVIPG
jgi:HAE1 family hydrophobic/amphiphilic exporter-1